MAFFASWETNDTDIPAVQLNQICYLAFNDMFFNDITQNNNQH